VNGTLRPLRERKSASLRLLLGAKVPVTIRKVKLGEPVKILSTETVDCSPPGGSVPDSVAACRALRDFLANYRPARERRACFAGSHPISGVLVEVYGHAAGRLVGTAVLVSGRCRFAVRWVRDLRAVIRTPQTGQPSGQSGALGPAPPSSAGSN